MIDETTKLRQEDPESGHTEYIDDEEVDHQAYYNGLEKQTESSPVSRSRSVIWTGINIVSTVAIVFTNKTIFSDPSFRNCQITFAAYHFFVTFATLWLVSRSWIGFFQPKTTSVWQVLPLSIAMGVQVILQNLGLAYSSVVFHQLSRLLLTPFVAGLNYTLYGTKLSRSTILPLTLLFIGVGIVSYYDSLPKGDGKPTTSFWGVVFALAGVGASSIYTVWVPGYHQKLELDSMQLMFNQSPVSAGILLVSIPWMETLPTVSNVPAPMWSMVLLSGFLATLVNLSGVYIIDAAGPVSSSVVAQVKTCIIVSLGWVYCGHVVDHRSLVGIMISALGMALYLYIMATEQGKK
ncbi:hypothetical protein FE257_000370 [Aspergillus nanangensis]|uniref:GDP-mannose transporter n=1 Tax=Aspergillus nanangensis TaxID=2582783 RepID=A0AAD4GXD9_ASPNN|nr:hypothetical protein FE257_000370 [Aspergillus nanangensis]